MDGPLPRAAFGVSRVPLPLPCTALYYILHRHHALYSSESHELARKKAATASRASARYQHCRCRRVGAHGLKKENLTRAFTSIRPLLGLFLFSVLTPWARIRQGPKTWHKPKIQYDLQKSCCILISPNINFSRCFEILEQVSVVLAPKVEV